MARVACPRPALLLAAENESIRHALSVATRHMPSTPSTTRDAALNEYLAFTGALSSLAREDKARRGEVVGRVPLGYLPESDGIRLSAIPDSDRAPIIAEAFRSAARPGSSVSSALREATAAGLTSHAGMPLAKSAMHAILTNPFYAGTVLYLGDRYPGRHEPLVTKTLFEKVQRRLRVRRC